MPTFPPVEEWVPSRPRTIAEIQTAVRSAVEASSVPRASQARPGVDCLLWLCVQAGRFREAVDVHIIDRQTGLEVRVRRAVQQELSFEDVSLDSSTRARAQQFLEGTSDHDEEVIRHSLEVLTVVRRLVLSAVSRSMLIGLRARSTPFATTLCRTISG